MAVRSACTYKVLPSAGERFAATFWFVDPDTQSDTQSDSRGGHTELPASWYAYVTRCRERTSLELHLALEVCLERICTNAVSMGDMPSTESVSYTHLTLPTKRIV
eukprot:TRINITY_DN64369_c0_g1_i1.p2 TRINITY_DN64369_c0_g1~~TRINITY_DN64369_c0_g1_i1.p2  ORF type:complete len:105 (+),score=8.20 TRINITY_DN64369_c0_g1_i1:141-455(+)